MGRGESLVYEEIFQFACPKFVTPASPNYEESNPENSNQEATKLQCSLFLNMVKQAANHNTMRSYLKLYTTIPTSKLAKFLNWSDERFRQEILSLKHKSNEQVWNGGSATDGVWATSSDVDFYIDEEMVHVAESKVVRKFGDFFIRHINKFEEIIDDLNASRKIEH